MKFLKFLLIVLIFALAGCAAEKPRDATDPKKSELWIKYLLKQSAKRSTPEAQALILIKAYKDAAELKVLETGTLSTTLSTIPNTVYSLSIDAENFEAFKWAVEMGAEIDLSYPQLLFYWNLGADWQDYIMAEYAEPALPILMNEAVDHYTVRFFDRYVTQFKQSGYRVKSPLEQTEFNVRFCRFFAEELAEALYEKDRDRIEFLLTHMPELRSVVFVDRKTKENMKLAGDYVFNELKDEALACRLLEMGYDYNKVDLKTATYGEPFYEALRRDPEYAIRLLQVDEWNDTLSDPEGTFLRTLPSEGLRTLNKVHLDDTIRNSMKHHDAENTLRLIQLKAEKNPLNQGAYTELLNWSLEFGDRTVFDFVMKNAEDFSIYSIDFSMLAKNQKLFSQYAPLIMKKIHHTMETYPRSDGTTLGQINEVFAADNEKAGLFLVQNYNLNKVWTKTTDGRTLLMDICLAGNLEAARFLIENKEADLHAATGYGELQISIFGSTRPTEGKLTPIFFAAKSGNAHLIKYLASKGANVNARSSFGTTPLMHAVTAGHLEAVRILIALHAQVNMKMNSNLNSMDLRQIGKFDEISNPYRRAETSGNTAILDVLKKAGARP